MKKEGRFIMSKKQKKAGAIPGKVKFGWSASAFSMAFSYTLVAYLSLYATDVMGLGIGAVGVALMLSKIFDGFTDVVAGILIDKTHSKWGKARPYTLAIVPYWIVTALLFSAPKLGEWGGIIYLFVMYTLANSIFLTLYNCSEAPLMANALEDTSKNLDLIAFSSVIATVGGLAGGIIIPQIAAAAGNDGAAWAKLAWIMAVPLSIVGMLRFALVKEIRNIETEKAEHQQFKVKDMLSVLVQNKYIFIVAILVFISYFATALTNAVSTYYTKYIIGDIGAGSILSLAMLPVIVLMVIVPGLAHKFTLKKTINVLMVIGIIGCLVRYINPESIAVVFVSGCLFSVSLQVYYGFFNSQVIECMDYGEWKNGVRVEGIMASMTSLTSKIGNGIGGAVAGLIMAVAGYNGTLEVQSAATLGTIKALSGIVPAAFIVLFMLIFRKYDLEAKMPQIRAELEERRKGAKAE